MRRLTLLPLLLLATLAPLHAQPASGSNQGWTQQQFDDWIEQVENWLDAGLHEPGSPKETDYSVDVCVQGKIVIFHIHAIRAGEGFIATSGTIQTNADCLPSVDENGNPLPYTSIFKNLGTVPGLSPKIRQPLPQAESAPARDASTATSVLVPARSLPFPPIYDSSVTPPTSSCDSSADTPLLLVNHGAGTVTIFGGCSGIRQRVIPVVSNPLQADTTPDGKLVLVTSFDSAINFIDVASQSVSFTLRTTADLNPNGIAISPDGAKAYVTSFASPSFGGTPALLTVDIAQKAITQRLSLPEYPQSVFLSPDGSLAWITFPFSNQIYIVDTLSNTVVKTLRSNRPMAVAFNSTGQRAWVSNGMTPGTVTVYETTQYSVLQTVPVGSGPIDVVFGPDDAFVLVNNYYGQSISIVNPLNYAVQTASAGGSPMGFAFVQ